MQFKDFWKGDRGKLDAILAKVPWKNIWLVIVLALVALLLFFLIPDLAFSYYYSDFFRILTSQGGINAWLARTICLLFAAAVYKSLQLALFNLKKQRREMGWALLLVSFVVFNLLMYACTRSNIPVVKDPNFVQGDRRGQALVLAYHHGRMGILSRPRLQSADRRATQSDDS